MLMAVILGVEYEWGHTILISALGLLCERTHVWVHNTVNGAALLCFQLSKPINPIHLIAIQIACLRPLLTRKLLGLQACIALPISLGPAQVSPPTGSLLGAHPPLTWLFLVLSG